LEDDRGGLAGANGTRVDAGRGGEELEEVESGFEMGYVDGVGVRE
jgi:hypothetical protein